MSGSPIAVFFENDLECDGTNAIVGVATSYRKRDKLMFGTDIAHVISAIKEYEESSL